MILMILGVKKHPFLFLISLLVLIIIVSDEVDERGIFADTGSFVGGLTGDAIAGTGTIVGYVAGDIVEGVGHIGGGVITGSVNAVGNVFTGAMNRGKHDVTQK